MGIFKGCCDLGEPTNVNQFISFFSWKELKHFLHWNWCSKTNNTPVQWAEEHYWEYVTTKGLSEPWFSKDTRSGAIPSFQYFIMKCHIMRLQTNQELIWPLEAFNPREDAPGTSEVKTNGAVVASLSCLQPCLDCFLPTSLSSACWFTLNVKDMLVWSGTWIKTSRISPLASEYPIKLGKNQDSGEYCSKVNLPRIWSYACRNIENCLLPKINNKLPTKICQVRL